MGRTDKSIETMLCTEIHTALADYFGVAAGDITRAFAPRQTEHLCSVLRVGLNGRAIEKQILLTGAGFTAIAGVMLEPAALCCAAFGAAATIGLYATQRLSRRRMDQAFYECLKALEHGQPK
jgi:hypothetical protein